ncbi:hypothetical protein AB0I28_18755 [Phytomonospora sp. NPDC050363]|uniref:hypothetical protein n=1 Tax=Phytomonospora sp. NPDC050363 TaxID=3155642 RepID=UPI0033FB64B0
MPAEDPADPRPLKVLATLRPGTVPTAMFVLALAALIAGHMTNDAGGIWWGDILIALAAVAGGPILLRGWRLLEVTTWDLRFAQVGTFGAATILWQDIASVTVTRRMIVVRTHFGTARRMAPWLGGSTAALALGALLAEAAVHEVPVHFAPVPTGPDR